MPDREKVIIKLANWINMPFALDAQIDPSLVNDALALLREQEPVEPINAHVWAFAPYRTFGRCGNCEAPLPALEGLRSKFCWMCGKAVKWDE